LTTQLLLPCLVIGLFHTALLQAKTDEFATFDLNLAKDEVSLLLDGQITFNFSQAALEALENGLPLGVEIEANIRPVGKWYWPRDLVSLSYKLEIQYHALSQHYLVKAIGYQYPRAFLTRSSALAALGMIDELALIELQRLDPEETYQVSVRSILDSESLPVPLRPLTYLSEEWRLRSKWKHLTWPEDQ
jgi:hypothetical protein